MLAMTEGLAYSELLTFRGSICEGLDLECSGPVSLVINFSFVFIIYFVVALWIVLFKSASMTLEIENLYSLFHVFILSW